MAHSHDIARRPRLIIALLLAFTIDTLRPAAHPASHQHPGGELPHVHVGDVAADRGAEHSLLFGAHLNPRTAPSAHGKCGLAAAAQGGLHVHLFRSLHVGHVAPLAPIPRLGRHLPARAFDRVGAHTRPTRPSTARAPPLLAA